MMLETVHRQHEQLRQTYKAQLSIEKADRLELERMLKEETAKREAAEREAETAQREKEALAAQAKEKEMMEKFALEQSKMEAERARFEAEKLAFMSEKEKLFQDHKSSSNLAERRPTTPRQRSTSGGSSSRARSAVTFKEAPETLECREVSPTRSRFGSAVNTAFAVGGAALTAAVAVPIVTGLLAVDALKFVRGDKSDASEPEAVAEDRSEKAATGSGHRRRWSVANDGREVSYLAPKSSSPKPASKMVDID